MTALVLGVAVLLAGCSGGSAASGTSSGAPAVAGDAVGGSAGGAAGGAAEGSTDGSAAGSAEGPSAVPNAPAVQQGAAVPSDRALIQTVQLVVQAEDPAAAADAAVRAAVAVGGFAASQRTDTGGRTDGTAAGSEVVLRVPGGELDGVLTRLRGLGKRLGEDRTTQDVTDQVVDVDSRVASQKASVARVRALLAKATSIGDVVTIEAELAKREADLEALEAKQGALADQTSLATITASFRAPDVVAATAPHRAGFLGGLTAGWHAFTAAGVVALAVLGAVLPFALTGALVAGAVLLVLRALRRRRTSAPQPAGGAPAS
ncbi:MAG: DUF4349 domain-containing protein [Motilibacteraceae bacterium]